jgi:hypothetical protein
VPPVTLFASREAARAVAEISGRPCGKAYLNRLATRHGIGRYIGHGRFFTFSECRRLAKLREKPGRKAKP